MTAPILSLSQTAAQQLRARIAATVVVDANGCRIWQGAVDRNGYGLVGLNAGEGRRATGAHRAAWLAHVGPISAGFVVDHLCRQRRCVNTDHMELVSAPDNTIRGVVSRHGVERIGQTGRGTPKITLRIDPALWERFGHAAAVGGHPRTELLRAFVAWYLRDPGARLPERPASD